jgi:deoxyribose-phosphate aldolase
VPDHLDMVINIAAVKNNDWETVENEIDTINRLVKRENKIFKLIAETCLMSEIELELICKIANDLKIDYLKTSTGVNGAGANMEVVTAMREMLDKNIKIKASGGIRTRAAALELIEAGADRIGASKSVEMMG